MPYSRSSRTSTLPVGVSAHAALVSSLAFSSDWASVDSSYLNQTSEPTRLSPIGFHSRPTHLQLVFGVLALDGVISPMLGWLRLSPSPAPLLSASGLFHKSALGFFSRSKVVFSIRLNVAVSSAPFLGPLLGLSRMFSPSSSARRGVATRVHPRFAATCPHQGT